MPDKCGYKQGVGTGGRVALLPELQTLHLSSFCSQKLCNFTYAIDVCASLFISSIFVWSSCCFNDVFKRRKTVQLTVESVSKVAHTPTINF